METTKYVHQYSLASRGAREKKMTKLIPFQDRVLFSGLPTLVAYSPGIPREFPGEPVSSRDLGGNPFPKTFPWFMGNHPVPPKCSPGTFWLEHAPFPGNVIKQGNIYTIKGNKGTGEPGTKKGNIRGIPVFLEKRRTSRQFRGTLFPGNMQLSSPQSTTWKAVGLIMTNNWSRERQGADKYSSVSLVNYGWSWCSAERYISKKCIDIM